jgi:hypothetical protein
MPTPEKILETNPSTTKGNRDRKFADRVPNGFSQCLIEGEIQ